MNRLTTVRHIREAHPNWHWVSYEKANGHCEGWLIKSKIGLYDFEILIKINDWEFLELPSVYIKKPAFKNFDKLLPLPHLTVTPKIYNEDSFYNLCYAVTSSLSYDNHDKISILRWCFNQTVKVLHDIFINKALCNQEALREIVPIWSMISTKNFINVANWYQANESNELAQRLCLAYKYNDLNIESQNQGLHNFFLKNDNDRPLQFFVLEPILVDKFPGFPNGFLPNTAPFAIDLKFFLNWLKSFSQKTVNALIKAIVEFAKCNDHTLFLSCLNINRYTLTFCVEITALKRKFPELKNKLKTVNISFFNDCWVVLTHSTNLTPSFIYKRNIEKLFPENLSNKKVILIGCGAIGGYLGLSLARLGAGSEGGELILIDSDTLESENVGRHALGKRYIGYHKAMSLKFEINEQLPALNISDFNESVINAKFYKIFEQADLIIDATATSNVSQRINEVYFSNKNIQAPILYTWIMGNGECVQSLFVDKNVKTACRSCIDKSGYPIRDQYDALAGLNTIVNFSACSDYTPYSVSASQSASVLATDLILDWLRGNVSPRYRTRYTERWVGNKIESADYLPHKDCHVCQNAC